MFSLNPFSKSQGDSRCHCHHLFANGRRCRNPLSPDDDHLCRFHRDQAQAAAAKAAQEAEAAAIIAAIYGQVADLNSPLAVAQVLSNLFRLIAEDRIPLKQASLLNSTARAILRALKDHEIAKHRASDLPDDVSSQPNPERFEASNSISIAKHADAVVGAQLAVPAAGRTNAEAETPQSPLDKITLPASAPRYARPILAGATWTPGSGSLEDSSAEHLHPLQPVIPPQENSTIATNHKLKISTTQSRTNAPKPPRKSIVTATDTPTPCHTYKEALEASLSHSTMTPDEKAEFIKQNTNRGPYDPNDNKRKDLFVKFRPRRFRGPNGR